MQKNPTIYALLVVLLVALGMGGCGSRSKTTAPTAAPTAAPAVAPKVALVAEVDRTGWPVIVAFGDSLTFGQGVSPERNYPAQLQAELDRQGYRYRVVNAGISGDTTSGGVARIDSVLKQKPAIVVLELGANDGLRGQPVAQMKQNLAAMIEQLQQAHIQVVLAGMQIPPNYGPEYTQSFQQTFPDLAAQYHTALIPFFLDGPAAKPELNMPDGIHPTADGYVFVVQNVMGALQPLLKQ
jgi:acyl-CoA thioesterase I